MRAFIKSPLFLALAVALAALWNGDSRNFEHAFWNPWFKVITRDAPPTSIIVSLDARGDAAPLPPVSSTFEQAKLVEFLLKSGAKRIFLDLPDTAGMDRVGDQVLHSVIAGADGRVVLVNRGRVEPREEGVILNPHRFEVPAGVSTAFSAWNVNFAAFALSSAPTVELNGRKLPAVALLASGASGRSSAVFPDYGIDPSTIQTVSARQILSGREAQTQFRESQFRDRDLYITRTDPSAGMNVGYFGHYMVPMAAVDISAASALANGKGVYLGWHLLLLAFVVAVVLGRKRTKLWQKLAIYGAAGFTLFVLPALLMNAGYVATVGDAQIAAITYALARSWQKWRERVRTTSAASGLPNIEALSEEGIPEGANVVAVSVSHYEQMLASLPRDLHAECARQIARRLAVAAAGARVYDNDNGHFVWLVQPYALDALVTQFEGLKALFSSPLIVGGHVLDTNVHFGLDRNASSSAANRIRSAIVSSSEAQSNGKLYEEFGHNRLVEAPWELSLNARIDDALRNGDIWLAFQPQYDLRTDRVSGAETLIRWTDPERGAISPDSFIIQAERAGRIDALTYWVLDKAMAASDEMASFGGEPVQLSVNLSAWMVDQPGLGRQVAEIVANRSFNCSRITLEVTETFSMTNREEAKRNLDQLREMGFRLSIDDFGTGQASLAYLSEIPCGEIKLDRRFVQSVNASKRDRAIVASTIQLAHALDLDIVAEGVEDLKTLQTLRELNCDIVQGYLIGKPMNLADFLRFDSGEVYRNQVYV